ncbi:TPA: NAD(P)/FAD-dependent oxidoreductase [Legionella pneumophila]|uniref:NAD(P)/FAD-dependent oxidoreductase n=1 Tax=Legionella TaxID=445 RepID=UPI000EFF2ECB|nr:MULTISPECIES: FAD/NAD(P)-binding oxidoreductase [Legionella]MCK1847892.1 NAD(P)/FAD-dependent oxidoreductase [Legionella pneumophila]RMX17730.1 NAD(P)/FAD-dependent oxidoreductase [Legionella jordanis]HAT1880065.1 NAD(P)/FAD-dependent oxidoreductase [Legionella pneumophila]HAU0182669.1 NAD(P)/FAD-dependent oxidoreductase [Legionella pneumophila]HAU0785984.1 NAD(P)/FAD-dependent oxidoreductase [Legionella pneumophila]
MANIVVLGGGIGGISAVYGLKERLDDDHKITLINEVSYFQFVPSNVWAGIGWRNREEITVSLDTYLHENGIHFIPQSVERIDAQNNQLYLLDGANIHYDYLVITTGAKLAFEEVPGAGPINGFTHSICTIDHAESTFSAYQEFLKDPGPVIIGTMPGASCFGPAYEFSFVVNSDLRKRKLRHKVPITYVTSEPYIGHLGIGGVNDSKTMLESELRKNNINFIANAKVTKVEPGQMTVSELDSNGTQIKEHVLPFKLSMMIPSFKGVDAVAAVEGLCNPRGFVLVDEHQRSIKYTNIYSAGVCIAIPPVETTPVPTGVPKTGYMIETMVTAIVENIFSELENKPIIAKASRGAICLADLGDGGMAFVATPEMPPRNIDWAKKGKWVHLAKIAFEKYFLYKVRHGLSEPVYEKYILKMLGINRLE